MWDQLQVDSCGGSICESCIGKDVSWSCIINNLDVRETFDVVSSQLLLGQGAYLSYFLCLYTERGGGT